jgi:hypothetical protein
MLGEVLRIPPFTALIVMQTAVLPCCWQVETSVILSEAKDLCILAAAIAEMHRSFGPQKNAALRMTDQV